jgi:hypothetical protein
VKLSSDNHREAQPNRRARFVAFCRPQKFNFYGFACLRLLRIKIRVASFSENEQDVSEFSFANPTSIYRVAALSLFCGELTLTSPTSERRTS